RRVSLSHWRGEEWVVPISGSPSTEWEANARMSPAPAAGEQHAGGALLAPATDHALVSHGYLSPPRLTPRLSRMPSNAAALGERWRAALGDFDLLGAWQNHFRRELGEASWRDVLDRWLPRLISGGMAAGTHGIIRCGHAAGALADAVTAPRLDELTNALAYCAAPYPPTSTVPPPT